MNQSHLQESVRYGQTWRKPIPGELQHADICRHLRWDQRVPWWHKVMYPKILNADGVSEHKIQNLCIHELNKLYQNNIGQKNLKSKPMLINKPSCISKPSCINKPSCMNKRSCMNKPKPINLKTLSTADPSKPSRWVTWCHGMLSRQCSPCWSQWSCPVAMEPGLLWFDQLTTHCVWCWA